MNINKRAIELLAFMNAKYYEELDRLKKREAELESKLELSPLERIELVGIKSMIKIILEQLNNNISLETLHHYEREEVYV